jgi:hypothetical protein
MRQPLSQRDELFTVSPVAQLKEISHQAEAERRRFIGVQCFKLGLHLDGIHC